MISYLSLRIAKIQNVFNMVVTLQPFLIQFSRFLSKYHKKHIKYNLLSERNENLYTIKRCRILIAVQNKKRR